MTPELTYLLWSAILLIAHVMLQAIFSDLSRGLKWGIGPRDTERDQSLIAGRIHRSLQNFSETYPAFIVLALLVTLTDSSTWATATGATLYFWSRVAYVAAYVSAIPLLRSIIWFASIGGLLMMAYPLLLGGGA